MAKSARQDGALEIIERGEMAYAMERVEKARVDWWMESVKGGGFRVRLFSTTDTTGRPLADEHDDSLVAAINRAVDRISTPLRRRRDEE